MMTGGTPLCLENPQGPFGYVGMSARSFVADGMNEKGLIISVQTLYRSEYQHCNPFSKERPGQLAAVGRFGDDFFFQ